MPKFLEYYSNGAKKKRWITLIWDLHNIGNIKFAYLTR